MKQIVLVYILLLSNLLLAQLRTEGNGLSLHFYTLHKLGRIDSVRFYTNPVFLLQNNTDTAYVTSGYGGWKDTIGMLEHYTYSRVEKKNGKWKQIGMGWCGNGLHADTIFPGEKRFVEILPEYKGGADSVKFTIGLQALNDETWRSVTSDAIVLK
jgi:hypothetical protein